MEYSNPYKEADNANKLNKLVAKQASYQFEYLKLQNTKNVAQFARLM